MSDVTIFGPSLSSYLRTSRMACEEKGITHTLDSDVEFGSDQLRALLAVPPKFRMKVNYSLRSTRSNQPARP